jgi:hypothetical protein
MSRTQNSPQQGSNSEFLGISRFLTKIRPKTYANSVTCEIREMNSLRNRTGNQFAATGNLIRANSELIRPNRESAQNRFPSTTY